MRIGYLGAAVGHDAAERERRRRIAQAIAGNTADIEFLIPRSGPTGIDTPDDEQAAVDPIVELATRHQDRFDGFMISCFGDIGIHQLRHVLQVPVVAPARTTYALAAAAFPTFAILSLNDGFIESEAALVTRLGIRAAVSPIVALNMKTMAIVRHPEQALTRMRKIAATVDAPAIVPGCMSMAYLLEEHGIRDLSGCRVVNPLRCGIRMAVALTT